MNQASTEESAKNERHLTKDRTRARLDLILLRIVRWELELKSTKEDEHARRPSRGEPTGSQGPTHRGSSPTVQWATPMPRNRDL